MTKPYKHTYLWLAGLILFGGIGLACLASGAGEEAVPTPVEVGIPTIVWRFTPQTLVTVTPRPEADLTSAPLITSTSEISSTLTPTPSPIVTPTPDPLACVLQGVPEDYGLVKWIIDGATIVVDIRGGLYTVHYAGIDVPATTPSMQPFGPTAKARNAALVLNQVVRLVQAGADKDAHGQLLRYVFLGRLFINYELVKEGWANPDASSTEGNTQQVGCMETFRQAEQMAMQEGRGVWTEAFNATSTILVAQAPTEQPGAALTASPSITRLPLGTLPRPSWTPQATLPAASGTALVSNSPTGTVSVNTPHTGTAQATGQTASITPHASPSPTKATSVPSGTLVSCESPYVCFSTIIYTGSIAGGADQYAEIQNISNKPVDLTNWKLHADKINLDFTFPLFDIQPGQVCRIYSNELHPDSCGFSFGSSQAVWNATQDCGKLLDAKAGVVSEFCYPKR